MRILQPLNPIPEIRRALKREFPKAGIRAVGLGRRRRERLEGRPLASEIGVKILLRKKLRPLPRGIPRIPKSLHLETRFLGQTVAFKVPVDIEQSYSAIPTFYQIRTGLEGDLVVGAYALWQERSKSKIGVVTAGHGLWKHSSDSEPIRKAGVILGENCEPQSVTGKVRCASHLKRDHLDVALLELPRAATATGIAECFKKISSRTNAPTKHALVNALGNPKDDKFLESRFTYLNTLTRVQTISYWDEYRVSVKGWGMVKLQEVVESEGKTDDFRPGTSGSGIVERATPRMALAIQGLRISADPSAGFRETSLGTSFAEAKRWLEEQMQTPVELAWDLPTAQS